MPLKWCMGLYFLPWRMVFLIDIIQWCSNIFPGRKIGRKKVHKKNVGAGLWHNSHFFIRSHFIHMKKGDGAWKIELYTDLSTISTEMNRLSCGKMEMENKRLFCEKSKKCAFVAKFAIKSLTEENGKWMLKYIKKTGKEIKNLIIFNKKYWKNIWVCYNQYTISWLFEVTARVPDNSQL